VHGTCDSLDGSSRRPSTCLTPGVHARSVFGISGFRGSRILGFPASAISGDDRSHRSRRTSASTFRKRTVTPAALHTIGLASAGIWSSTLGLPVSGITGFHGSGVSGDNVLVLRKSRHLSHPKRTGNVQETYRKRTGNVQETYRKRSAYRASTWPRLASDFGISGSQGFGVAGVPAFPFSRPPGSLFRRSVPWLRRRLATLLDRRAHPARSRAPCPKTGFPAIMITLYRGIGVSRF
jgi:hypothetical protein